MTVVIRRASEGDVVALNALVHSAYRGDSARAGWTHEADLLDGQRTDGEALRGMLSDPSQAILVAQESGALLGCVHVSQPKAERATLGMLSVHPDSQAQGLGRRLIDAAEQHARALGVKVMEMTVIALRGELIAYYARRGYLDTGRRAPFPLDDPRFGLPRRRDLDFVVLAKTL